MRSPRKSRCSPVPRGVREAAPSTGSGEVRCRTSSEAASDEEEPRGRSLAGLGPRAAGSKWWQRIAEDLAPMRRWQRVPPCGKRLAQWALFMLLLSEIAAVAEGRAGADVPSLLTWGRAAAAQAAAAFCVAAFLLALCLALLAVRPPLGRLWRGRCSPSAKRDAALAGPNEAVAMKFAPTSSPGWIKRCSQAKMCPADSLALARIFAQRRFLGARLSRSWVRPPLGLASRGRCSPWATRDAAAAGQNEVVSLRLSLSPGPPRRRHVLLGTKSYSSQWAWGGVLVLRQGVRSSACCSAFVVLFLWLASSIGWRGR